MKQHPPGRCMDQACRGCWGPVAEKPVFPRPASQVAKYLQYQEYDRQFNQFIADRIYPKVPPPGADDRGSGAPWCSICMGPCIFGWGFCSWGRRSPYDNGNVIEGEVVHSHTYKELTQ